MYQFKFYGIVFVCSIYGLDSTNTHEVETRIAILYMKYIHSKQIKQKIRELSLSAFQSLDKLSFSIFYSNCLLVMVYFLILETLVIKIDFVNSVITPPNKKSLIVIFSFFFFFSYLHSIQGKTGKLAFSSEAAIQTFQKTAKVSERFGRYNKSTSCYLE